MNITITTTTSAIKVNFNDTLLGDVQKGTWRKDKIFSFRLKADHIQVNTFDGEFYVAYAATTGAWIIDSVDGVAPSSLSDLYDKLVAMLG
jgi:hypothetical protein